MTDVDGYPICEDMGGAPLSWVQVEPFTYEDIDPEEAGELFAIGFVIYGTAWAIGKGAALIVNSIRRL